MRRLRDLPVPQDGNDAKFPDGQIRNESNTETGTPVVRELYGDIVTNIYKIIRDAGIDFTNDEDGEDTQYQLLDALKVFTNKTNDLQHIITVDNLDLNLGLDFDNLPNNYVFIGKVSDNISTLSNYTINSSGNDSYPVNVTQDIAASSIVLIVLNSAGTTIIALGAATATASDFLTVGLGNPLSFNSSDRLLYFAQGDVITDVPSSFTVEQTIQGSLTTVDVKVLQVIALKGKLICFTLNTTTLKYQAFAFDLGDLSTLEGEINLPDLSGADNQPYMYCDGEELYFTNSGALVNDSVNDYSIGKFAFDEVNLTISSVSFFDIDASFQKTTNVFINRANQRLFTLLNGTLAYYGVDGGGLGVNQVGFFNTINGQVFSFNGSTYYSNGETATKWNY